MTERLWFLDTLVTLHVRHDQGADGTSVLESRAMYGDSPPLHIHDEDEIWHVQEGDMLIRVGDQEHQVTVGQTLLGPRGVPHTYRVMSPEARWLVITARGNFEKFVRAFSRPADGASLPAPTGPPSSEQAAELAAACRSHGIELVGPPLAESHSA
jgi:mannose-6-phosphate isomerase-like protein (cupin superfamily)